MYYVSLTHTKVIAKQGNWHVRAIINAIITTGAKGGGNRHARAIINTTITTTTTTTTTYNNNNNDDNTTTTNNNTNNNNDNNDDNDDNKTIYDNADALVIQSIVSTISSQEGERLPLGRTVFRK